MYVSIKAIFTLRLFGWRNKCGGITHWNMNNPCSAYPNHRELFVSAYFSYFYKEITHITHAMWDKELVTSKIEKVIVVGGVGGVGVRRGRRHVLPANWALISFRSFLVPHSLRSCVPSTWAAGVFSVNPQHLQLRLSSVICPGSAAEPRSRVPSTWAAGVFSVSSQHLQLSLSSVICPGSAAEPRSRVPSTWAAGVFSVSPQHLQLRLSSVICPGSAAEPLFSWSNPRRHSSTWGLI